MPVEFLRRHVCDRCGHAETRRSDYYEPSDAPLPRGWHLLDRQLICPAHEIVIQDNAEDKT